MRLLLFSDIHCHKQYCQNIVKLSQQADVVIGAGDFAMQRQGLEQTFKYLDGITKPFIIVPGNNEDDTQLETVCKNRPHIHILHGSGIDIDDLYFFGVGGGIPITPFGDWSFDISEEAAEDLLLDTPEHCILITHSPPKGILDRSSTGQSLGSVSIKNTVLKKQPRLNVCGHIHGSAGKTSQLGNTTIINAGPRGTFFET